MTINNKKLKININIKNKNKKKKEKKTYDKKVITCHKLTKKLPSATNQGKSYCLSRID
jgi:hypothetical protein